MPSIHIPPSLQRKLQAFLRSMYSILPFCGCCSIRTFSGTLFCGPKWTTDVSEHFGSSPQGRVPLFASTFQPPLKLLHISREEKYVEPPHRSGAEMQQMVTTSAHPDSYGDGESMVPLSRPPLEALGGIWECSKTLPTAANAFPLCWSVTFPSFVLIVRILATIIVVILWGVLLIDSNAISTTRPNFTSSSPSCLGPPVNLRSLTSILCHDVVVDNVCPAAARNAGVLAVQMSCRLSGLRRKGVQRPMAKWPISPIFLFLMFVCDRLCERTKRSPCPKPCIEPEST